MKSIPTVERSPAAAERQLEGFVAKFEPTQQALIRSVRKALRRRLPTAYELVYDNYNPLRLAGRGRLIIRSVSSKQRPRRKPPR